MVTVLNNNNNNDNNNNMMNDFDLHLYSYPKRIDILWVVKAYTFFPCSTIFCTWKIKIT